MQIGQASFNLQQMHLNNAHVTHVSCQESQLLTFKQNMNLQMDYLSFYQALTQVKQAKALKHVPINMLAFRHHHNYGREIGQRLLDIFKVFYIHISFHIAAV